MRKMLLLNIAELIVGLGIGYINYEFVSQEAALKVSSSIIIGLLASLLFKTLIESYQNELRINELNSTYQKMIGAFTEKSQDMLIYAKIFKNGTVVFSKEKAVKIWLDLLWISSSRYWSTNYIKEIWDTNISELALEIQSAKVHVDKVDMRRVFIIDNDDEFEALKSIMKLHSNAGVKVRYIYHTELEAQQFLWRQLIKLDSFDVSLINSEIVFQVLVDKHREIKFEKVYIDSKMCRELEELYIMVFDISHEYN